MCSRKAAPPARFGTFASILLLTSTAWVELARAESAEPVALRWTLGPGAESCLDAATLERRVEDRLGWDAIRAGSARTVVGKIERRKSEYVVQLHLEEGAGATEARSIESADPDCRTLDASILLSLALVIDPLAPPVPSTPPQLAFPDVETSAPPSPEAAPSRPSLPRPSSPPMAPPEVLSLSASIRALYVSGLLPESTLGVALEARKHITPAWSLAFELRWLPANELGRYAFGFSGGAAGVCRSVLGPLEACAGLSGGAVSAVVASGQAGDAGQQPWFGVELGPRVVGRFSGLRWELGASAGLPLVEPRFLSDNEILPSSPFAFVGFVGLGPTIP